MTGVALLSKFRPTKSTPELGLLVCDLRISEFCVDKPVLPRHFVQVAEKTRQYVERRNSDST